MITKGRGQYQKWFEDAKKEITEAYVTTAYEEYISVFEVNEVIIGAIKTMKHNSDATRVHWSIFTDEDSIMPSQIGYRCMTNYRYATERYEKGCPIAKRLLKPSG